MKDLYNADEYCMAFSNETIKAYFLDKIKGEPGIELKYNLCKEKKFPYDVIGNINSISLNAKDEYSIRFFGSSLVAVFVFGEIFMFIDHTAEEIERETGGCIVYEGNLREKTHEQILEIFLNFFKIVNGTKKIEYEEQYASQNGFHVKSNYTVKLIKPNQEKQTIQFENILFLIN